MKKVLYLGLDPTRFQMKDCVLVHYPIIEIAVRESSLEMAAECTHILCTSRTVCEIVLSKFPAWQQQKNWLAIGQATGSMITGAIVSNQNPTAEGFIGFLSQIHQPWHSYFYPHSSLARPLIKDYLEQSTWAYRECILYDTHVRKVDPIPKIDEFDEIVFTSPSTVDAFIELFGDLPRDRKLNSIGPVTENYLNKVQQLNRLLSTL